MSDAEKKASGVEPLDDSEMEAVAGGNRIFANDKEEKKAKEQAAADGRTHMLRIGSLLCVCSHKYKYARDKVTQKYPSKVTYYDIKCYYCGKTLKEVAWDHDL